MKIFFKVIVAVFAVAAVLELAGCGESNGPVSAVQSQTSASPSTVASSAPATAASGSATAQSTLLGGLLGPSVNCVQTCSSPSAAAGASVTYTVSVAISGGTATACQITDVLPAGLSYVQGTATSIAGGTFTCTGQTLTWVYNSLGPCNCVMTYVAKVNNVASLVGQTLANTTVMTCAGLLTSISSTVNLLVTPCACTPVATNTPVPPPPTPTPAPAVVTLSKTCSEVIALTGDVVTYTLHLNITGSAANSVTIQDVLPSGCDFVADSESDSLGAAFSVSGQTLTWIMSQAGPCSCNLVYKAKVDANAVLGAVLSNIASLTSASLPSPVTCMCNVTMATPTFTFTPVPPTNTCTPVPPTPTFTFTNTFTPVPPTPTFTPTDTFTDTFTPVPPTPTFTSTPTNTSTNTFTSTNTSTPTDTFTFTNTFTPVPPTATFTSTSTSSFTPVPPTPTFTFTPVPVVVLSKTCSEVLALTGDVMTYTLHLNVAGSAADSVTIQDVLPSGCNFVQGSESDSLGAAFSVSGQTLTWIMSQAGPCACNLTYQVLVNGTALVGTVMSNIASLTCESLSTPVTCLCNVTMEAPPPTPTPIAIPTITLGQACSSASAALGAAVTYTLNLGVTGCGCAAHSVTIQDVLPTGLSYVQGTATVLAGGAFSASGQTLTWIYSSVGPCSCTMTYVAQVDNLLTGLVGSTVTNSAVLSCPSLSSSLTASVNLLITGLLGLGL